MQDVPFRSGGQSTPTSLAAAAAVLPAEQDAPPMAREQQLPVVNSTPDAAAPLLEPNSDVAALVATDSHELQTGNDTQGVPAAAPSEAEAQPPNTNAADDACASPADCRSSDCITSSSEVQASAGAECEDSGGAEESPTQGGSGDTAAKEDQRCLHAWVLVDRKVGRGDCHLRPSVLSRCICSSFFML